MRVDVFAGAPRFRSNEFLFTNACRGRLFVDAESCDAEIKRSSKGMGCERVITTIRSAGSKRQTYPSIDFELLMLFGLHQLGEQKRMIKKVHMDLAIPLV